MTTTSFHTKPMKSLIEEKMDHPFLNEHIQRPEINDHKLKLLTSIVNLSSLSAKQKKYYIIATMLVQVALDTHDQIVDDDSKTDEKEITNKQLTVLAGDYYSGLYYLILSELKDIDLIQVLASAIKEVNEFKMQLNDVSDLDTYFETIEQIESHLLVRITEYISTPIMGPVVQCMFIIKQLTTEKQRHEQDEVSIFLKWPTDLLPSSKIVMNKHLDQRIRKNIQKLEHFITKLPSDYDSFKPYIYNLLQEVNELIKVVEEG